MTAAQQPRRGRIRVAHISDLHFCADQLRGPLARLAQVLEGSLGLSLDLHFCDLQKFKILVGVLQALDPDVVCITGDVSTFGDDPSFELAARELAPLKSQGARGRPRDIIAVPGNHDHLQSSLGRWIARYKEFPWLARICAKRLAGIDPVRVLAEAGCGGNEPSDPLDAWHRFVSSSSFGGACASTHSVNNLNMRLIPFNTVSKELLLLNMGQVARQGYEMFHKELAILGEGELRVLLMHHNPLSDPTVEDNPLSSAYNSLVNAGTVLREAQRRQVQLVLHGHHHGSTNYSIDFWPETPGRLFVLGCPGAALEGQAPCGFSLLDFDSQHHLRTTRFHYDIHRYVPATESEDIVLEAESTRDAVTLHARAEIAKYRYRWRNSEAEFAEACNRELEKPAPKTLVIGTTLRSFTKLAVLTLLRHRLGAEVECEIRVVMMRPSSLAESAGPDDLIVQSYREQLATEADASFNILNNFVLGLSTAARSRLQVRTVARIVPFGATIVLPTEGTQGTALVELLPVGAWDEDGKARLYLSRRQDKALYDFFHSFAEDLWNSGRPEF